MPCYLQNKPVLTRQPYGMQSKNAAPIYLCHNFLFYPMTLHLLSMLQNTFLFQLQKEIMTLQSWVCFHTVLKVRKLFVPWRCKSHLLGRSNVRVIGVGFKQRLVRAIPHHCLLFCWLVSIDGWSAGSWRFKRSLSSCKTPTFDLSSQTLERVILHFPAWNPFSGQLSRSFEANVWEIKV